MNDYKKTIVYVTREIERALGVTPNPNYLIVSNKTPYGENIKKQYPDFITLIENPENSLLGTTDLLNHNITKQLISDIEISNSCLPNILVFKNTIRVESAALSNKWQLLNPKSYLSERVENKLSQIRWLGDIGKKYLPPHTTKIAKLITWKNEPFIIQWAHGHTGDGTILIKNHEELSALQEKFPERMARLTAYIKGSSFTVNVVVSKERILMGNISYQITGMTPFTDNEFSTIGNDWSVAQKILTSSDIQSIQNIVHEIGTKLQLEGWRGLFGVDIIRDDINKRIFLIEVNARQPASSTFESFLEEEMRKKGARGLTTFETHIRALLELPINENIIEIKDGAQIVQRVTKNIQGLFDDIDLSLEKSGYHAIYYQNTIPNSDLLRVQSIDGIMEDHNLFNTKGKEITETIRSSRVNIQV